MAEWKVAFTVKGPQPLRIHGGLDALKAGAGFASQFTGGEAAWYTVKKDGEVVFAGKMNCEAIASYLIFLYRDNKASEE